MASLIPNLYARKHILNQFTTHCSLDTHHPFYKTDFLPIADKLKQKHGAFFFVGGNQKSNWIHHKNNVKHQWTSMRISKTSHMDKISLNENMTGIPNNHGCYSTNHRSIDAGTRLSLSSIVNWCEHQLPLCHPLMKLPFFKPLCTHSIQPAHPHSYRTLVSFNIQH